jgi:hypothetical protein
MEKLALWNQMSNEISETARSMQTSWQNDMLWPRIERALREERRSASRTQLWRIAAAFILTLGLAATTWYALRIRAHEAAFDKTILTEANTEKVDKAEVAYAAAIEQLEKSAEAKLDAAETPLMVSYKEKLMVLDDAIAECQVNIDRNRQNAHLRSQLLTMYREKQRTLHDVLREGSNVSQP